MENLSREGFSSTPYNKAVAGMCGLETMNKELTKLETEKEAPEIANASYAKRCNQLKEFPAYYKINRLIWYCSIIR